MAVQFVNYFEVDLQKPTMPQPLRQMVGAGDINGLRVGAVVTNKGEVVSLGGTCVGKVVRADGATVTLTGTIDGNVAYVVLDQNSCAIEGPLQVAVCWVSGSNITTLLIAYGTVVNTQTGNTIQPSTPIPDLAQLLAAISDMQTATAAATAAAEGALGNFAPAFVGAMANLAGSYVTYTDGKLYYLPEGHTANVTWTNTAKQSVTVGSELGVLKSALIDLKIPFESGSFSSDGVTKTEMVSRIRNVYPISRDAIKSFTLPSGFSGYCYKLAADFSKIGTTSYLQSHDFANLESNVQYLNIMIRKDDATTSNITEYVGSMTTGTTVVTDTKYLMSALATLDSASLIYRGNLADLSYTTIAQCTLPGLYKFTGTYRESITDLPSQWGDYGGYVKVYKVNTDYYQFVCTTNTEFCRLGITGTWYPKGNMDTTLTKSGYGADAKVVGDRLTAIDKDLMKCCMRFNTGSYRSGDAIARLQIFIPQPIGYLRYDMYHYKDSDTTKNRFELWGIDNAYSVKSDRNTSRYTITNNGEWEMAVRLKNGSDFSGGITHGDEKNYSIVAFADGKKITIEDITSLTYFDELKIVQTSDVYSPSEDATEQNPQVLLAHHGTEWIYTKKGLRINQYLKWVDAFEVTNTFLAMFPVRKTATVSGSSMSITDTMFANTDFDEYDPSTSGSVAYPKATSADIYSTVSGLHCTVNVIDYPFGLPGGDQITESDNGGNNYYKIYVPITSSNDNSVAAYTTSENEIWKSSVEYVLTINHGTGIADS